MALREDFTFLSSDGRHQIHAVRWTPDLGTPRAAVQLVHGISEYIERYDRFAVYLADRGYVVTGHDHLGHGKTAGNKKELGFLGLQNGWDYLIHDIRTLREDTGARYPRLPYVLLGHSMGSFAARTYLIDYPGSLDGCILLGTGQEAPALVAFGKGLSALWSKWKGPRSVSGLITFCSLGLYNRRFRPNRTSADWISRDEAVVDAYVSDPMCRFVPTAGMFHDLMGALEYIARPEHLARMDPATPVALFSGGEDPVGGRGKGVRKVESFFRRAGCRDLTVKLYPGARHELLNETNRDEVYADILTWLEERVGSQSSHGPAAPGG